jgi:hypothetical protein
MMLVKKIGAFVLLAVGIGEILPIYLISSGLLLGQGEDRTLYFLGKLGAHVLIAILFVAMAIKLFKSANLSNGQDT